MILHYLSLVSTSIWVLKTSCVSGRLHHGPKTCIKKRNGAPPHIMKFYDVSHCLANKLPEYSFSSMLKLW